MSDFLQPFATFANLLQPFATFATLLQPFATFATLCNPLQPLQPFATLFATHQAPLSMEFSRQEYWSGLSHPPTGDLPDPETEPVSLVDSSTTWEGHDYALG